MAEGQQERSKVPVYLRLRPCSEEAQRVVEVTDSTNIRVSGEVEESHRVGTFTFVFPEDTLQEDVFKRSTLPLLESVLQENKNALLLAYGASGSGKTHTVSGGRRSPGVLPMTINYLFQHLENSDDFAKCTPLNFDEVARGSGEPNASRGMWISVIQVYNEVLTDLLTETAPKPLQISQDSRGRCFIRSASWTAARSERDALRVLQAARSRQSVFSTKQNKSSSRSHFAVFVKFLRKIENRVEVRQVAIVDLAGTERQAATGSSGTVLRQAGFINSSLLVLRRCVDALRKGVQPVPFRDSKLTRLLSPFLTLNQCRTAMIICISTSRERLGDTLTSIKFGGTASELIHPQETVNRIRETRRRSGGFQAMRTSPAGAPVVEIPDSVYKDVQADLRTAEKLAIEAEELRRQLQTLEESSENSKLMFMDKLAAQRKETREAMKALREEQDSLRTSIQDELQAEMEKIAEKNAKYKKQGRMMATLIRQRLYPELELFRQRHGYLKEFPPLEKDDIEAFGATEEPVDACVRCESLAKSLDETTHKLQVQIRHNERLAEQLRSERELRVLLQERSRSHSCSGTWSMRSSSMELTCDHRGGKPSLVEAPSHESRTTTSGDSGNETHGRSDKSASDDAVVIHLQAEIQRLREDSVYHTWLLDQREFALQEFESRYRELEETHLRTLTQLSSSQEQLRRAESVRETLGQRPPATPCQFKCDRCLQTRRRAEIPRTAPTKRNHISPPKIRESALTFTPVFCGGSRNQGRYKKDLPRRRLKGDSSSDDNN